MKLPFNYANSREFFKEEMMRIDQRRISRLCFLGFCSLLIVSLNILSVSCSPQKTIEKTTKTVTQTTQKIRHTIRFSDDDLQRLAAVVGFENRSLYRAKDFAQLFRKGIPEYLNNECDDVTVPNLGAGENVERLKGLPMLKSGRVDNFTLATIGRQLGLNAVVTGSLDDIGLITETQGLILKDTLHSIQILVSVEVYDTETGTKILDENFNRKVEIEELDYDLMRSEEKLILPDLNETVTDLLSEMGERICWAIEEQPWNGFISSFAGDKVMLSVGDMSGLKPGDELEVFDNTRILKGRDGQQFFIHGKKIGEIRIVAVETDSSEAVVVSDNGIKTGSSVRVK
jgi:hypothetical protein